MADDQTTYNGDIRFNDAAFEFFFKEQFAPLCAWCRYKFGFDIDAAKDIVHTAFIQLWKHRNNLSSAVPVQSYLHTIIINKSLDVLKRRRIQERYLQNQDAIELTHDLDQFDLKKLQADIHTAISELPEQMRRIFEMSRYEGLKYGEIARHLNVSVNTVETQMSRALAKLRVKLANWLPLIIFLHPVMVAFFLIVISIVHGEQELYR
jgi:RNA polymerase sigma-70 factor, ECF subfamily